MVNDYINNSILISITIELLIKFKKTTFSWKQCEIIFKEIHQPKSYSSHTLVYTLSFTQSCTQYIETLNLDSFPYDHLLRFYCTIYYTLSVPILSLHFRVG